MANSFHGTQSSAHASDAADAAAVAVRLAASSTSTTASTAAKNQWTGKYLWCPHICMARGQNGKGNGEPEQATPESRAQLKAGNGQRATGTRLVWSLPKWQKLTVAYAKWSLTRLGVNAWRERKGYGRGGCTAINRHKNKLQLCRRWTNSSAIYCVSFFTFHKSICRLVDQRRPKGIWNSRL